MPRPRTKYRAWAPTPAERSPPFLLVHDGAELVLIAPFAKRPRGPAPHEAAIVRAVAEHLSKQPTARGPVWIDPATGTMTPAMIGGGQLQRRLVDNASFGVAR